MNANKKYLLLVKRELWEHRALWMAPLAAAAVVIVMMIFGGAQSDGFRGRGFSFTPPRVDGGGFETSVMTLVGFSMFFGVIAAITVLAYLLDCLYAERKDRSILFWKSLPVSDTETVLAKFFVAMVLVPVGVLVFALLLQPVFAAIFWLRFESLRPLMDASVLQGWFAGFGRMLVVWLYALLWHLPWAAYLMLASVIARRSPVLYATLPIAIVMLWENLLTDGPRHVTRFLLKRMTLGPGSQADLLRADGNRWELFQDPALWIGVAVGAGMLYTVIRLRRYRDET